MIKYISYASVMGALNISGGEYCEAKSLQSPYVENVDDDAPETTKLLPVLRCEFKQADLRDPAAIMACLENRKGWLKL